MVPPALFEKAKKLADEPVPRHEGSGLTALPFLVYDRRQILSADLDFPAIALREWKRPLQIVRAQALEFPACETVECDGLTFPCHRIAPPATGLLAP